jgi:hypothetical protein
MASVLKILVYKLFNNIFNNVIKFIYFYYLDANI